MRIAFDEQVCVLQEYGGISRYICNLARELLHQPGNEVHIQAPLHFNRILGALEGVPGKRRLLPRLNPKLFRMVMLAS